MLVFLVIVVLWFVIKLWLILTEDSGYTPSPYRPVYTKSGEFVYIISWDNNRNLKKIGRTTNPTSRMRTFETASPYKLYIHRILEVPNAAAAERQLHRHFAEHRVRGEWFNITDAQLNEINVVGSGDKFDPQTGRRNVAPHPPVPDPVEPKVGYVWKESERRTRSGQIVKGPRNEEFIRKFGLKTA